MDEGWEIGVICQLVGRMHHILRIRVLGFGKILGDTLPASHEGVGAASESCLIRRAGQRLGDVGGHEVVRVDLSYHSLRIKVSQEAAQQERIRPCGLREFRCSHGLVVLCKDAEKIKIGADPGSHGLERGEDDTVDAVTFIFQGEGKVSSHCVQLLAQCFFLGKIGLDHLQFCNELTHGEG